MIIVIITVVIIVIRIVVWMDGLHIACLPARLPHAFPRVAYAPFAPTHISAPTPSPPIKSLGFRGFDSSRLLILRGGNSHVR